MNRFASWSLKTLLGWVLVAMVVMVGTPAQATTGAWRAAATLAAARYFNTNTLLPLGQVLVVGGWDYDTNPITSAASAELYDPARDAWTAACSMFTGRSSHTATLLT